MSRTKMSEPFGRCGDMEYGDLQSIPDSRTENTPERINEEYTPQGIMASQRQTAGNHYVACGIQPRDYARANNFVYEEVLALRYLTRHRQKNGKQDLLKLIHCIELLIEAEYG